MIETFRVNIHLSIMKVKYTVDFWTVRLNDVTALYNELNSSKSLPDGHLSYAAGEESKGMEFELKYVLGYSVFTLLVFNNNYRNVTYKHIGADSRLHLALSNVSLKIPGSSLVVIVGTNGSGKSTLLSMLGRMHNPTSGKILLNGKPYSDYRDRDIRRAIGRMNPIVGCLTINENVKIGDEERTICSGIRKWYSPEDMVGKKVVVVANLKPRKMRGIVSHGMILCAADEADERGWGREGNAGGKRGWDDSRAC